MSINSSPATYLTIPTVSPRSIYFGTSSRPLTTYITYILIFAFLHTIHSSHGQLHIDARPNRLLQLLIGKSWCDPVSQERIHLLRRTPNKAIWLQEGIEAVLDWVKVRVRTDAVDQIVLEAKLFDLVRSFVRQNLTTASACNALQTRDG